MLDKTVTKLLTRLTADNDQRKAEMADAVLGYSTPEDMVHNRDDIKEFLEEALRTKNTDMIRIGVFAQFGINLALEEALKRLKEVDNEPETEGGGDTAG